MYRRFRTYPNCSSVKKLRRHILILNAIKCQQSRRNGVLQHHIPVPFIIQGSDAVIAAKELFKLLDGQSPAVFQKFAGFRQQLRQLLRLQKKSTSARIFFAGEMKKPHHPFSTPCISSCSLLKFLMQLGIPAEIGLRQDRFQGYRSQLFPAVLLQKGLQQARPENWPSQAFLSQFRTTVQPA